jgi:AraC family transcriptional activator FtrA
MVLTLAYDQMPLFEFSIAVELFGLDRPEMGNDWYEFMTASLDPCPVSSTAGIRLMVDGGLDLIDVADTIIIPGWSFNRRKASPEIIAALQSAHKRGARLISICSGAFLLAEAGLLDGKRATTHWKYGDELSRLYPAVRFESNVLYVDEGQILTSAGSAAGIDLGLHLIRRDFGPDAVNRVACRLIVPPHRDGGQAQYIRRAVPNEYESLRLSPLLAYLQNHLADSHTVKSMAARAQMSERTFLRRFEEATGMTPTKWLLQARLKVACDYLESHTMSVDAIASRIGFGTAANLRQHFRKSMGTTPTAYRQTFARNAA